MVKAVDVLCGRRNTGQSTVILGGGMIGCETARFLAVKGRTVMLIEMLEQLSSNMLPRSREQEVYKLSLSGVRFHTSMKAEEVTDKRVRATRKREWFFFEADAAVLVVGMDVNDALSQELKGKSKKVYVVGDATQPRKIIDAVYDGARVGREI